VILAQEATQEMIADLTEQGQLLSTVNPNPAFNECLYALLGPYAVVGECRRGDGSDEHNPILYDTRVFSCVDHTTHWLSETPTVPGSKSWDAACPRIATSAWLQPLFGEAALPPIGFVSTHFDHEGVMARRQSAVVLASLLQNEIRSAWPGSPIILGGDFNTIKEEQGPYQTLVAEAGLQDAWVAAPHQVCEPPLHSTIHKFRGIDFDAAKGDGTVVLNKENKEAGRGFIDWLLWQDGLEWGLYPHRCEVVTDSLESGRYPSDHFPISTTFTLFSSPPVSPRPGHAAPSRPPPRAA